MDTPNVTFENTNETIQSQNVTMENSNVITENRNSVIENYELNAMNHKWIMKLQSRLREGGDKEH